MIAVAPRAVASIRASPPWAREIARTIDRPSPAPCPAAAEPPRTNRPKTPSASSGGDPGSAVLDRQLDVVPHPPRAHDDRPGAVAEGVVNEVRDGLLDAEPVGDHGRARVGGDLDRATLLRGARGEAGGDGLQDVPRPRRSGWRGSRRRPSGRAPAGRRRGARAARSPRGPRRARPGAPRGDRSPARARSISAFRIATGVRSSWLASATKARSRSSAPSTRSSIAFSVSPSRRSSSLASGSGRRAPAGAPETSPARARIASTGRRAAAASR